MELRRGCSVTTLGMAHHGSLLLVKSQANNIVRGVKAYHEDENGKYERFITVGPFGGDKIDFPCLYKLTEDFPDRTALDISGSCVFDPSLAPEHLIEGNPDTDYYIGCVLLCPEETFLGFRTPAPERHPWEVGYLNLETGQIVHKTEDRKVLISRKWWLVEKTETSEPSVLFEHEAPDKN